MGDTTKLTLDAIGTELTAITAPGDKYILLITDGEPDYCNDGNMLCPPDSVVGKIQAQGTAGPQQHRNDRVRPAVGRRDRLAEHAAEAFANAGAGETVKAPFTGTDLTSYWDQCNNESHWKADIVAKLPDCGLAANFNTCRGKTVGDYTGTAGPTKPFMPDPLSQAAIATQLKTALASVKSCIFDLGDLNGQSIKVDQMQLGSAHVKVAGTEVPLVTDRHQRLAA